jgi:hypothetical protein
MACGLDTVLGWSLWEHGIFLPHDLHPMMAYRIVSTDVSPRDASDVRSVVGRLCGVVLLFCLGCGRDHAAPASGGPSQTAPGTASEPVANAIEPTLTVEGAGTAPAAANADTVIVAPGEEVRVHGFFRIADANKRQPQPVVQITRNENGVDVIHNSANIVAKREGDRVTFESVLAAPPETGSFRVEAVEGDKVIISSRLTVK